MRKGLVLILMISLILSVAGTALADADDMNMSPLTVNGSFKYEFRDNHEGAYGGIQGRENRMYFGLNFAEKIDSNTTAFMRIGGMVRDTNSPLSSNKTSGFDVDQVGVKAGYGNWNFSFGRQGAQLGQGSIFFAGNNIDPLTYFDGLVATTKFDDVNFKAVAGKSEWGWNSHGIGSSYNPEDWVGVDVNGDIGKVNVGAVWARKSGLSNAAAYSLDTLGSNVVDNIPNADFWGVNFSAKFSDAFVLNGEYAKSNASTANNAYTVSGTYSWPKDSFTVAYNSVQGNSVDPVNSAIGSEYYPNGLGFFGTYNGNDVNGYKGFTYAYHHDLTKILGFNAYLLSLKPYNGSGTDNEFAANLKWSF